MENEMSELIECPVDGATITSLPLASNTSESSYTVMITPPTKKAKGLSKVLGHCLGKSQSNVHSSSASEKRTRPVLKPSTIRHWRIPTWLVEGWSSTIP